MITNALLLKLFKAAYMQRWNDKLRPVDLYELDKQGHKMVIAYFLGKFEEGRKGFDWGSVIEGGVFELLHRIALTDLKPPILYRIREDPLKRRALDEWVYEQLEPCIDPLGEAFTGRFKAYFADETPTINRRVLSAAHFYATSWEFAILERANPAGYEMEAIRKSLTARQEQYYDLQGIKELALRSNYRQFIDMCGELRFQIRWSHVHRVPRTSVLGHELLVATISYLVSMELGACSARTFNNYFTGLFHDLPEVLTRDISSPIKAGVEGLGSLIKDIERDLMATAVYGLLPPGWHSELSSFTENEFADTAVIGGKRVDVSSEDLMGRLNEDHYRGRDGAVVKAADDLAAFIEAHMGKANGSASEELVDAIVKIRDRYKNVKLGPLALSPIYESFSK